MTVEIDAREFDNGLREALLDDIEHHARQDLGPELEAKANDLLSRYGERHDYDVGTLVEAAETEVVRDSSSVRIVLRYPDPALLFERGTVDHAIEAKGDGVLSFIWEDPPRWVQEEFEPEGDGYRVFLPSVEVSGLPEAAFLRDALNEMRRRLKR